MAKKRKVTRMDSTKHSAKKRKVSPSPPFSTFSSDSGCPGPPGAEDGDTKPSLSSDWQFEGDFDSQGGTLKGEDSDVELRIPSGAIKESESVTISGAVTTDLALAQATWILPKSGSIVSPVVEYRARGSDADSPTDFRFEKAVEIILPHFLPPNTDETYVTVYQVTGCHETEKLKPIHFGKLRDSSERQSAPSCIPGKYYLGEDNRVHVFVDHFTAFCVAVTCEGVCQPDDIGLELYARYLERENGRLEINVRLEILNKRLMKVKDFEKVTLSVCLSSCLSLCASP